MRNFLGLLALFFVFFPLTGQRELEQEKLLGRMAGAILVIALMWNWMGSILL